MEQKMSRGNFDKIENVKLQILKAEESSGNIQIFVRAKRTEEINNIFGETLEYHCFQTKHLDYKECLSRAWFSAGTLCNFFGHTLDDILISNLSQEDTEYMKSCMSMCRVSKK